VEFEATTLLLYLVNPESPSYNEDELAAIQSGHLDHLRKLGERGLVLSAGPFDNQSDPSFRGLVFFSVSPEEALTLTEGDPAVTAGRLVAQAMTWYRQKGEVTFKDFAS
jgi:uncharacterized protein YciI